MVRPALFAQVRRLAALCVLAAAIYADNNRQAHIYAQTATSTSSASGAGAANATIAAASVGDLIGWFDCAAVTFADELEYVAAAAGVKASELPTAQCAQLKMPLCHAGVCADAKKRTVDVFFKRIEAREDPASKPNVWFLQGGPGSASPTMELAMTSLYSQLKGQVNVYTMDHRGTGRSSLLDCVAAQATTSGSPSAGDLSIDEVAACAQELEIKFGSDLSAFSITSAATDIKSFISKYQSGSKAFVYGVSYGSALVERLIHLDTKEIVGYVLDGVSTTSGADAKDGMYMSNWDVNFGEVGDRFLAMCESDKKCTSKVKTTTLEQAVKQTKAAVEVMPCTFGYNRAYGAAASYMNARSALGLLLMREQTRGAIPAVLSRMNRCDDDDERALFNYVYKGLASVLTLPDKDVVSSPLLRHLIIFSEMWESPAPTSSTLTSRFENATMSTGPIAALLPLYCMFTKDTTSSACSAYTRAVNYTASPIAYKKDKFWNVAATIPTQASVLLMSGKLDPQTPHKYAERLYGALNGTKKELVAFEYAAHGTLFGTKLPNAAAGAPTCGMSILASYVTGDGDLSKLDKTCLSALKMSFEVSKEMSMLLFNTSEVFDGKPEEVDYYPDSEDVNATPFYIVVAAIAAMCILSLSLCHSSHKRRKAEAQAAALEAERDAAAALALLPPSEVERQQLRHHQESGVTDDEDADADAALGSPSAAEYTAIDENRVA